MSDGRGDLGIPSQPIRPRLQPPPLVFPAEIATGPVRRSHLTRRRIMYLVGLVTQAAVLGAVVTAGLYFEEPLRERIGLAAASGGPLEARMSAVDQRLEVLTEEVDGLAAALTATAPAAPVATAPGGPTTGEEGDVVRRIAMLERLIARVESKVDDVRDAQLFPTPGGEGQNAR